MNTTLQEKQSSLMKAEDGLAELQQRLIESENSYQQLLDVNKSLQLELVEKTSALENLKLQSALLKENLFELQNRTSALEDATIVKDQNLEHLEMNLNLYQEESEALKRSRSETSFFIKQAVQQQKMLSSEARNSENKSQFFQHEVLKLEQELVKARHQLKSLSDSNAKL